MKKLLIRAVQMLLFVGASVAVANDDSTDVIAAIDQWNDGLTSEERDYKYCRMAESPFAFLRGSNHLYWQRFHSDSRLGQFGHDKTKIWLQGDLHAENFGAFDNDKEEVVYGVNDFDDAVIADYQLDVWRMAASLVLVVKNNEKRAKNPLVINDEQLAKILDAFSESYLDTLESYRGNENETKRYFSIDTTKGKLKEFLEKTKDKNSREKMLGEWTIISGDTRKRKFSPDNEDLKLTDKDQATRDKIENAMAGYRGTLTSGLANEEKYFTVKDIARRLHAGTGSVGAARYYVLIEGKSNGENDDRILDVKEQSGPTAYSFMGAAFQHEYKKTFQHHAQRHAIAYRALTVRTDDHLGWMRLGDDVYSVRERSPYKKTYDTAKLNTVKELIEFAGYWGAVLATAHARADKDDKQSDAPLISYSFEKQVGQATDGKHKEFRRLVRDVAAGYATQVQADYDRFKDARKPKHCGK